jgi:glutamine synthetase
LCDIYFPSGKKIPFSTRPIYKDALADVAKDGYDFVTGLEVEFHVFKLEDPKLAPADATQPATPPEVSLVNHGFQYLTEQRMDEQEPVWEILRRDLKALNLPIRTLEVEFGPSQFEISFGTGVGLESADNMMLFRSAVKQICRRNGYHATFMCRPALPNIFSSGWHLHQSLVDHKTGANVFVSDSEDKIVSPLAENYAAGILEHARAASVFTTPTINGYKRYQPYTLAPDRILWGKDNKGAMLRIVGGNGDPMTHLENRVGEPAANPYLYMTSQLLSGMDGIKRKLTPPEMSDAAYETEAPALPRSLLDALFCLREDSFFRDKLGDQFIDYILTMKEAEVSRFLAAVTDWEHKEYFEIF